MKKFFFVLLSIFRHGAVHGWTESFYTPYKLFENPQFFSVQIPLFEAKTAIEDPSLLASLKGQASNCYKTDVCNTSIDKHVRFSLFICSIYNSSFMKW